MNVLVIGGGGREHALAWKLGQASRVMTVFVAPGNAGTAADSRLTNVAVEGLASAADFARLADFAVAKNVALTVVGPEVPLAGGIVDTFRARGLRIFGPTQAAARLESSKAFAKEFMRRHGIPTAGHAVFSDAAAAHAHIDAAMAAGAEGIVVKADGLAAGKGVVVATDAAEAHAAVDAMFEAPDQNTGGDGSRAAIVVEEFLEGEEASFIVMCDGRHVVSLATSQDHKRLLDGDTGPNTGGMGAYSPAPVVTPNVHARVMKEIIQPTVAGMAKDGTPFTGFLYAGLMIDAAGQPRAIEFNCRLGDPEAQPILMRLKSDLFEVLLHATAGPGEPGLEKVELDWDRRVALGIVIAASGYPAAARTGDAITGVPMGAPDAMVFHAGTAVAADGPVTSGGRVLCATVLADSVRLAQQKAYDLVRAIHIDGAQYRRDIGHRAIRR